MTESTPIQPVHITDPTDDRLADYRQLRDPAARRRIEGDEFFIAEGPLAIERLLEIDPACGTCLSDTAPAIATRNADDPALRFLKEPLGNSGRSARVVTPRSRARMLIPRPGELIFVNGKHWGGLRLAYKVE